MEGDVLTNLQDELKCGLCMDYSERAVLTTCCEKMYCEACLTHYSQGNEICHKCPNPLCDVTYIAYRISDLGRRLVERIPFVCPACTVSVPRCDKAFHLKKCPRRRFICPNKPCEFQSEAEEYMRHLVESHSEPLLEYSGRLFKEPEVEPSLPMCPYPSCHFVESKEAIARHMLSEHDISLLKKEKVKRCPMCTVVLDSDEIPMHIAVKHADELVKISPQNFPSRSSTVGENEPVMMNHCGVGVTMAANGKVYCGENSTIGVEDQAWLCSPPSILNCNSCIRFERALKNLDDDCLVNPNGRVVRRKYVVIATIAQNTGLCRSVYSCSRGMCFYRAPCRNCLLWSKHLKIVKEITLSEAGESIIEFNDSVNLSGDGEVSEDDVMGDAQSNEKTLENGVEEQSCEEQDDKKKKKKKKKSGGDSALSTSMDDSINPTINVTKRANDVTVNSDHHEGVGKQKKNLDHFAAKPKSRKSDLNASNSWRNESKSFESKDFFSDDSEPNFDVVNTPQIARDPEVGFWNNCSSSRGSGKKYRWTRKDKKEQKSPRQPVTPMRSGKKPYWTRRYFTAD